MIYDIYDASIHSYPAGRLSDGVSFDRKFLKSDIFLVDFYFRV